MSLLLSTLYYNTGVHITGIQSGVPILIGGSVTITCTTDSPADSIILLQDDQHLHETRQSTNLIYTIPLVTDSMHGNIFKCEAYFLGTSDSAFENVITTVKSKLYS